uniref:Kinesin motor domain-containing protein n=1 Tax=Elaeophora elaphi TaxID=1147741 RepID=A0A0R3RG50_9BILA
MVLICRMPLITLVSNIPASRFPSNFNVQFTKLMAEMLGKPVSRILLFVTPNAQLSHGATEDPSCLTVVSVLKEEITSVIKQSKKPAVSKKQPKKTEGTGKNSPAKVNLLWLHMFKNRGKDKALLEIS